MSMAKQAKQLLVDLSTDCEKAMQLVDTLLEEQACLVKMLTDRLGELSVKKEGMMFDLEKRFKANLDLAVSAGYPKDVAGFEKWVDDLSKFQPTLVKTFETLRSTLEHAKRLNNINGKLVAEQLAGLKDRIAILTAASIESKAQKPSDTYGPKGGLASTSGAKPRAVIR